MRTRLRRRGLRLGLLGLLVGSVMLTLLVGSVAAAPVCSAGTCTETFAFTGAEQSFVVPAGVTSIHVTAVGGAGQTGNDTAAAGGAAASVSADVAVTPGQTLYVEVGGNGTQTGAFGGGGASQTGFNGTGGGGGGASDIRTCSKASVCSGFGTASDPRLLVAGGGGGSGGGSSADAGAGGSAGATALGGSPGGNTACSTGGGGGGGATLNAGGTAGLGGTGGLPNGVDGTIGTPDQGGSGGNNSASGSGAGGGGGFYGGGGGGGGGRGSCGQRAGGGGGGAGSSYLGSSTSNGSISSTTSAPSVTITYTSVNAQLSSLLAAVTGVGPGKSLANKVKEVQAYVAANNTPAACSTLNGFIDLVKAQTGKKVTAAQATSFIAQANTIKTTLGC